MRTLVRSLALVAATLLPLACGAAPQETYTLDKHYKRVLAPLPDAAGAPVSVKEVFWYGCPHCYHFDPFVEKWLKTKPAHVAFSRVPSTLGRPIGELHARAFYAAQTLGVFERLHKPLFEALHEKNQPLDTPDALRALFAAHGVKAADFDGAYNSFVVDTQFRRSEDELRGYGIAGVPTIIVGGTWQTSPSLAGGMDPVFKVVEFLVEKVRRETK